MRIVIDLQGAQAVNRFRGIGRYSQSLALALAKNRGEHEVYIALNGLFPDSVDQIRAEFGDVLPNEFIKTWFAPAPVAFNDPLNLPRQKVAEILYEQFLASMAPDIVLITSLFEGFNDDAVTSLNAFTAKVPTAVILYDLIPFLNPKTYLENPTLERWYKSKLEHLMNANLILSISDSSANEVTKYLKFDADKVKNISSAAQNHFKPAKISNDMLQHLAQQHGVVRPFVMYTGGIDHRKNIENLILAYASLPKALRNEHQLVIVCSVEKGDRDRFQKLADSQNLSQDDIVFTGFVSEDDLVTFYQCCKFFIFPSWHEGFGLPALEAMQCGKAVIASNTSSLPEVIGRDDALFFPHDPSSIAKKMAQVLSDEGFREELETHSLKQSKKYSWDYSAKKAWKAFDKFTLHKIDGVSFQETKPKLAYISPLPPEASGISDYSAELLPKLSKHYEIEVIICQNNVSDDWIQTNLKIRDLAWFRENVKKFNRIMYHLGNSHFHSHMLSLLHDYPGVVVLHDFFMSGLIAHQDVSGVSPDFWVKALQRSHGWAAASDRYKANDTADVVWQYPCNLQFLQDALGVIVHSDFSRKLAENWYGSGAADNWSLIPLLRNHAKNISTMDARALLGLEDNAFIVCSYGMIGPSKLNHRLLSAWLSSPLADDPRCHLIFVGQNAENDYGHDFADRINNVKKNSNIKITGWIDKDIYHNYLAAADVGVQLRTLSRGETSAAVLDCMNYGLATIVNASGAMSELEPGSVFVLPEFFDDAELSDALKTMYLKEQTRQNLGQLASKIVAERHNPAVCAASYAEAIENFYSQSLNGVDRALDAVAPHAINMDLADLPFIADCIAKNNVPHPKPRQLLIDISELVQRDSGSGIQRVVREILKHVVNEPPLGWNVEPVYATMDEDGYRYARRYMCSFLEIPDNWAVDEFVDVHPMDVFLGLDLQPKIVPRQIQCLQEWHRRGISIQFIVYDLLPVIKPEFFFPGACDDFTPWLKSVARFDRAITISNAVAEDFKDWLQKSGDKRERFIEVEWLHLGADPDSRISTTGMPPDAHQILSLLKNAQSFISVGTVEPRKGYEQTLSAFEILWQKGLDVKFVLLGKQGWMTEALVEKLKNHDELGTRLFWLEGISDEYLKEIYSVGTCLIAASYAEGFGLPIVEAAKIGLPIVCRDIPVFREVAGDNAYYFKDTSDPKELSGAIENWMQLNVDGLAPASIGISYRTWRQTSKDLIRIVLDQQDCEFKQLEDEL